MFNRLTIQLNLHCPQKVERRAYQQKGFNYYFKQVIQMKNIAMLWK